MIVIDAHLDLAWNALGWNRDITLPIAEIRRSEAGLREARRGANTVSFPEMRKGEVAACLATLLARCSSLHEPMLDFPSREIASAMAQGQLSFYRIMESEGQIRMLKDGPVLAEHLRNWRESQGQPVPLGFILSMEGADPILSPSDVPKWWEDGLRVVEPVHYGMNAYAHGTGAHGGLTPRGRDLLKAMHEVGMVLDVTHLSDESMKEAMEIFPGPVMASHHNCRSLVPGDRQLSDEQIRRLVERDAVIGAALDSWMLHPGYVFGETPNSVVKFEAVVAHIDHISQIAGNARHSGIGSDLDGGFGREQSPSDLDTIADLQKIPGMLRKHGYSEADIEGIMHGNWLRFFEKALSRGSAV